MLQTGCEQVSQTERPPGVREGPVLLKPDADLLVEYLENVFGRAAPEELAVHLQTLDRLFAALGRAEIEVSALDRVVFTRQRPRDDDVLDLAHQDLDTGVEARGDGLVQDVFKPLLLANDAVQEVGPIDVRGLRDRKTEVLAVSDRVSLRWRSR